MLRITLTDEDREHLGAPKVVDYDHTRPRLQHIREVQRQCGLSWQELGVRLEAGGDLEALGMLMWVALYAAGVTVPWDGFDIDVVGTEVEQVSDGPKPRAKKTA